MLLWRHLVILWAATSAWIYAYAPVIAMDGSYINILGFVHMYVPFL